MKILFCVIVINHGALYPAAGHPADNFTVSGIRPIVLRRKVNVNFHRLVKCLQKLTN